MTNRFTYYFTISVALFFSLPSFASNSSEAELKAKLNAMIESRFGKNALKKVAQQKANQINKIFEFESGLRSKEEISDQIDSDRYIAHIKDALKLYNKSSTKKNKNGFEFAIASAKRYFESDKTNYRFYHNRVNHIQTLFFSAELARLNGDEIELKNEYRAAYEISKSLNNDSQLKNFLQENMASFK